MRPIHGKLSGQRVKQRNWHKKKSRRKIFQGTELCAHFGVEPKTLEDYLEQMSIPFHKDSNNDIWASIEIKTDDRPSRVDFSD
jgi:hypothetical protein